jgi:hypothetical protein
VLKTIAQTHAKRLTQSSSTIGPRFDRLRSIDVIVCIIFPIHIIVVSLDHIKHLQDLYEQSEKRCQQLQSQITDLNEQSTDGNAFENVQT